LELATGSLETPDGGTDFALTRMHFAPSCCTEHNDMKDGVGDTVAGFSGIGDHVTMCIGGKGFNFTNLSNKGGGPSMRLGSNLGTTIMGAARVFQGKRRESREYTASILKLPEICNFELMPLFFLF
jgi:hypothetical protein